MELSTLTYNESANGKSNISKKQLSANRKNAMKGGIKTRKGKDISKYNAITHGVFVQELNENEKGLFNKTVKDLKAEFLAEGITTQVMMRSYAIALVRLNRAIEAESDYWKQALSTPKFDATWIAPEQVVNSNVHLPDECELSKNMGPPGHAALVSEVEMENIQRKFARYIAACERQLYRALHELQRINSSKSGTRPTSLAIDVTSNEN